MFQVTKNITYWVLQCPFKAVVLERNCRSKLCVYGLCFQVKKEISLRENRIYKHSDYQLSS
jgi:hypothetical protein